jgi:hypothetical protein
MELRGGILLDAKTAVYDGPQFTSAVLCENEKRIIFKQMVVSKLEGGFLRYSSRQSLMHAASQLGIGEFEATLLIAEAQYYSDDVETVRIDPIPLNRQSALSEDRSALARIGLALITGVFVDLLVVFWLFV